jgi:putative PEP-CTERM system histidine kinase
VNANTALAFTAALFSLGLTLAVIFRKQRSVANWCFSAGMTALAIESIFGGLSVGAGEPEVGAFWQSLATVPKSFLPGIWLFFSLTYSRGNYRAVLARWRPLLVAAFVIPVGLSALSRAGLVGEMANVLNGLLLIATAMILMNLERTFRSAVGTMQWRIKFLILGLGIIFGVRIYTCSQALLFSRNHPALINLETVALLLGCALMSVAYLRKGFSEIDVYPSHAVLQTSLTVLLVGGYLVVIGVLAQIASRTGEAQGFEIQAFVVLLGVAVLAVLLVSNRVRQNIQRFVSRHFRRPEHDFRKVWTDFTHAMSSVLERTGLCAAAAKLISETFNALSVTIWLFDEEQQRLVLATTTSQLAHGTEDENPNFPVATSLEELRGASQPFDLEKAKKGWALALRQISSTQFRTGGHRICAPLLSGERWLGVAVLADRVSGVPYTLEELELLKCIADQVAAALLNIRLTQEIVRGKEMEAFQIMSAFFVHDLKNAASTLSLMLKNLPIHFDDPAFRQDALRGIGEAAQRINQIIERLSVLRHKVELEPVEFDLNLLVNESLENLNSLPEVKLVKTLQPLPKLVADRGQLQSVITNLLLNARDAVGIGGQVTIETGQRGAWAALSVADDGCGMSPAFLRDSLFRPFQTTKKKGLGIGMFQSRMIVEAHRGSIQVKSSPGTGTTFWVLLPLTSQAQ